MAGVAGICIGIVLLTGLAVFIYYLIYTHNINQKIKSGGISGRKLIDIPKAIMITVIVVLVLFCGILSHSLQSAYHDTERDTRNHYAVINVSDPQNYEYISYFGSTELDDASFAKVYSIDQNPGYTKEIIKDGDFTFTVFKRSAAADSFHPDFLCYCEYTGKRSADLMLYNSASFSNADSFTGGGSGGNVSDTLLYIGNIDEETTFTISLFILDEKADSEFMDDMQKANQEDKGEFPSQEEFALESGKVSIHF